jgi:hypothetical protein
LDFGRTLAQKPQDMKILFDRSKQDDAVANLCPAFMQSIAIKMTRYL